jgi:hypothetical protein
MLPECAPVLLASLLNPHAGHPSRGIGAVVVVVTELLLVCGVDVGVWCYHRRSATDWPVILNEESTAAQQDCWVVLVIFGSRGMV